jgi:hypothetical protein
MRAECKGKRDKRTRSEYARGADALDPEHAPRLSAAASAFLERAHARVNRPSTPLAWRYRRDRSLTAA